MGEDIVLSPAHSSFGEIESREANSLNLSFTVNDFLTELSRVGITCGYLANLVKRYLESEDEEELRLLRHKAELAHKIVKLASKGGEIVLNLDKYRSIIYELSSKIE